MQFKSAQEREKKKHEAEEFARSVRIEFNFFKLLSDRLIFAGEGSST